MLNNESGQTRADRAKKFWDLKGSWVLLALVAFASWMGGNGFQAWVNKDVVSVLQSSYDTKEAYYRGRIKELNEFIRLNLPQTAATQQVLINSAKDVGTKIDKLTDKLDKAEAKGLDDGKD